MMRVIILVSTVFFAAIPVFAAKVYNPACKDLVEVSDKFNPEYLAVVDGYNKAGRSMTDQIDLAEILTESSKVKERCLKDKTVQVETVLRELKKTAVSSVSSSQAARINLTKAKCEDFTALGEEYQPVAAFWVAGHSKSGKVSTGQIDEEYLERPMAALIKDCKASPTTSFYNKAQMWVKGHI